MSQLHRYVRIDDSFKERLAQLIKSSDSAVLAPVNGESAVIVHLKDGELGPRPFPVLLKAGAKGTDYGAVIFIQLTLYDQPGRPLGLEVLVNADSPALSECFVGLEQQATLPLRFFHGYQSIAAVRIDIASERGKWGLALQEAEAMNSHIPVERRDFNLAKAVFTHSVPLMTIPSLIITAS